MSKHDPATIRLAKTALKIDESYQRNECINEKLVEQIRNHYNPNLFQPLTVALRPDGTYYIMDGQHRFKGVEDNPHVETIECHVIRVATVEEEAELFKLLNTKRTAVGTYSRFKAAVRAKQAPEIKMDAFLRQIGLPPVATRRTYGVKCLGEVLAAWNKDAGLCKEVLLQMREIVSVTREQVNVRLFRALFALAEFTDGVSLGKRWTLKLVAKGQKSLVDLITASGDWKSRTGSAATLAKFLNSGHRTNKLPTEKLVRAVVSGDEDIPAEEPSYELEDA